MLFPESWLRTFVNPDLTIDELAHTLTMAGLEVEDLHSAAPMFSEVVVARITAVDPHPNADRLSVCQVDDGSDTPLQIVCGAPNAKVDLLVPLARVGARLPENFTIKKAKMRGVESFGMLCSGAELGLSQDHDGLLELSTQAPVGTCLREALALDEQSIELSLTPNRADCLSVFGVAREVAALTHAALEVPDFTPVPVTSEAVLPVTINAPDLCGRFAGRVIEGVNAKATTPEWMVERLLRSGQRPVSVLVDISNYVMLELGRPTHVFDLHKLSGELTVQWGKPGQKLTLLTEQTVPLDASLGVITSGDEPVSLAGIMGGASSAVSVDTTDIYLEGAFWWPEAIMGRARNLKVSSEASHRFERGVDAESVLDHLEYVTRLIVDICGGQAGPLDDQQPNMPTREPVTLRVSRCQKVLGLPIPEAEMANVFTRLGFEFTLKEGLFTVIPPAYRFDLSIEEDLIEEVARIVGFEQIPAHMPIAQTNIRAQSETHRSHHDLRDRMAALDYQEVVNFAFVAEDWETRFANNQDPIRLLNPIASHLSVMRSSLIGGLLANVEYNAHHRQTRIRVFELGRVFFRDPDAQAAALSVAGVRQPTVLAGAAWGPVVPEQWGVASRQVDFFDVKHDVEVLLGAQAARLRCEPASHPALHPGRSAQLWLGEQAIGWLGEVHPEWVQKLALNHAPVVFELMVDDINSKPLPVAQKLSRQPAVIRDLAIWVNTSVRFQQVSDTINNCVAGHRELSLLKDFILFDVWRENSKSSHEKSLALRFWFQSPDTTLDDATVERCMDLILGALDAELQARVRR